MLPRIQPSALLADTVLLQPVPAWSTPGPPRNDAPRIEPTLPDLAHNAPHANNAPVASHPTPARVDEPATVVLVTEPTAEPEVPRAVG